MIGKQYGQKGNFPEITKIGIVGVIHTCAFLPYHSIQPFYCHIQDMSSADVL